MTRAQPYVVGSPPALPDGERRFLLDELRKIEATLRDVVDLSPQETTTEPRRPRSSMIRRARAPWRPVVGQTTDAWVYFDGDEWVYL